MSYLELSCWYWTLDSVIKADPACHHTVKWTWELGWRWKEGWTINHLLSKWEFNLNNFFAFSFVPKHKVIERRFRDPFLPLWYYPAVLDTWKVEAEFRSSVFVNYIHCSTSFQFLGVPGCLAGSSLQPSILTDTSINHFWLCSHSSAPFDAALQLSCPPLLQPH